MIYNKPALDYQQIILQLKNRGIKFHNEQAASSTLKCISYFRIASYLRYFESNHQSHTYKGNTFFEDALYLYNFDKELRQLLFYAIQSIEIAFRSKIIHHISLKHGSFWLLNSTLCKNQSLFADNLQSILREVKRSKEDFIQDYFTNYNNPCIPPTWKTLEVTSFGTLSKLYTNLSDNKIKKIIAREFNLPQHSILESWIKSIVLLRNCIAHHARTWNRRFSLSPQVQTLKLRGLWIQRANKLNYKLYNILCCIIYLLDTIEPTHPLRVQLHKLFIKYPNIDLQTMGFPNNWENETFWSIKTPTISTSPNFSNSWRNAKLK